MAQVLAFERAAIQTLLSGEAQVVRFPCEPLALLRALGEGRLPEQLSAGEYILEVTPETATREGEATFLGLSPM